MKSSILLLALIVCSHCKAQSEWKETSDWKIYSIADRLIFSVAKDSLSNRNSRALETDTMLHYMALATKFADSVRPIWMGGFLLSYRDKGVIFEIQISSYGGFFFDQKLKHYYVIPKQPATKLLDYLNRMLS